MDQCLFNEFSRLLFLMLVFSFSKHNTNVDAHKHASTHSHPMNTCMQAYPYEFARADTRDCWFHILVLGLLVAWCERIFYTWSLG